MTENNFLKFFFIIGVGRSGTTLLMSMMNAHPSIALPPELHFIGQYIVRYQNKDLSIIIDALKKDKRFSRIDLNIRDIIKSLSSSKKKHSAAFLYKLILIEYARKKKVRIIGDKAPKNIEYLPIIKCLFPEAYIIHIIRDPRDVYLSRTKAKWSSSRAGFLHYIAYRSQYKFGHKIGPRLFKSRYLEIKYENLLSHPTEELKKICELLDVSFSEGMLEFSASSKELVSQDELSWKKEVFGPLLTKNMNKWQKELSPNKIRQIESSCLPVFKDGFYRLSKPDKKKYFNLLTYNFSISILSNIYNVFIYYKNLKTLKYINKSGTKGSLENF